MEKVLLNVGDSVYECGNYGIVKRLKIERVTAKRAFIGSKQLDRESDKYGRLYWYGSPTWSTTSFYVETPERKSEWERKTMLNKLSSVNWEGHATETLAQVLQLITPKQ